MFGLFCIAFVLCSVRGNAHQMLRGQMMKAPEGAKNIVLFQCDEMDGRIMDPSHPIHKVTRLQNLESMTASGVNFVATYTASPICAPSRASMFTGRHVSSIEAWNNVKSLTADVSKHPPTEPDPYCATITGLGSKRCLELGKRQNVRSTINLALEELGYTVKLFGKMDTGGGPVMNPKTTHSPGFHDTGMWEARDGKEYFPGCLLHSYAAGANISKPVLAPLDGPNDWVNTESTDGRGEHDWLVVNDCVKFLESYKQGDPPFFLYCSVVNPHPPYASNATWEAYIDLEELDKSVTWVEKTHVPLVEMHPANVYTMRTQGVPAKFNRSLARDLNMAYHGATAMVDSMVGSVRDALHKSEAASNTYMVFASDHGEMHLEHNLIEKMSMFEASARVPLIIEGPGVPQASIVHDFVSLIDLFPTFLDMGLASALPDAGLEGNSLAPFVGLSPSRELKSRPSHIVSEYFAEESNTPQFMIREGDYKYIAFGREPPFQNYMPQLFNVRTDPYEVQDLARQPSMQTVVDDLDAKLRSVIDYPSIVKTVNSENRENVRMWMAASSPEDWKSMVRAAYKDGDDNDVEQLLRWLDMRDEFAP